MSFLANGGHGGPANLEALVLAIPMVVVGVILFVQKSAKPIVPLGLVLGGFAIAVGGFTFLQPADDHQAADEASDAEVAYGEMVGSLCDAESAAAADDVAAARTIFLDDVHVRLHGLVDRLSDDRAVAARLLEAKQAVEADLEDAEVDAEEVPASAEQLARDLEELASAASAGLAALDLEVDGCDR